MSDQFNLHDVDINSILIEGRHRQDLGDIEGLATSIKERGQLQPIGLDPSFRLIWGERRVRALEMLGHKTVTAIVGPFENLLEIEIAENTQRKAFTPIEVVEIGRHLEAKERERAKQRQGGSSGTVPELEKGQTRDKIGAALGVSGKFYETAKAVVEAAEDDPDRYQTLVDDMARTGKVKPAYNKLTKSRDEDRILSLEPIDDQFHTLVIDPPWKNITLSDDALATLGYALMELEEIENLDPNQWAMDDFCHYYIWCPNNFLAEACRIATQEWGLTYRNVMHWIKPGIGTGHYTRNSSEQVLICTTGDTKVTRINDQKNEFFAPKGDHSEKPDKFFDIVERMSYPPYGEVFQRKAREGFTNIYKEKANGKASEPKQAQPERKNEDESQLVTHS